MATLVKFRIDKMGIFAIFPQLNYNKRICGNEIKVGYVPCGQHTSVHMDYAAIAKPATEQEYAPLKAELESIGYTLKVCK